VFTREREKALLNAEGVANGAGKGKGKKRKRKEKKKAEKAEKRAKAMEMNGPTDAMDRVDRVDSESGTSASCDTPSPSLAPDAQPALEEQDAEAIIEAEPIFGEVYDETLLAVIGVLDEIKQQSNVAGWIRAGGLWGPLIWSASGTEVKSTGNDADAPLLPQDQLQKTSGTMTPDADKAMWFDHEPTFTYWVRRGREALDELGIEVTHGIVA